MNSAIPGKKSDDAMKIAIYSFLVICILLLGFVQGVSVFPVRAGSFGWRKSRIMTPSLGVEGGVTGMIGEPTVIYENSVWRMWYSCNMWHVSQTCYAESSDAVKWSKFGRVTDQRLSMIIRHDSNTLYFYTQGLLTQWSNDGIHWTHFAQQYGVLGNQGYDGDKYNPSVLQLPDGSWLMYYECTPNNALGSGYFSSCLASSPDGIHNWVRNSVNPVLGGRAQGFKVGNQDVIYDNGVYYMFWNDYSQPVLQIALSTSADGVHWTQVYWKTNPLIARTVERFNQIGDQEVVVRSDGIYVFYAATSNGNPGYSEIWLAYLPNTTLPELVGATRSIVCATNGANACIPTSSPATSKYLISHPTRPKW
ncbi:MAG: hypothetical protein ABSF00_04755 [Candidatus Bathyarchaeia archaeon]|jgi:hypothetical protein